MGQSATIYRVTESCFASFREGEPDKPFESSLAEGSATFAGTHCGLEFILCKVFPDSSSLVQSIFNPGDKLGPSSTPEDAEDWFSAFDDGKVIPYLPANRVRQIDSLFRSIDELALVEFYAPELMNHEGVYPEAWSAGCDEDVACNERALVEDFMKLKAIFKAACDNDEYLFVFVG